MALILTLKIQSHLGDGTFGRTLQCIHKRTGKVYAIKVIRGVKRYNESAEIEARILLDMKAAGGDREGVVRLQEKFVHSEPRDGEHVCLVFEP
eukprot:CAMPEP_0202971718 /NCGR_PEP_ID=MMETSP1396-20130829/30087_1 /ASSEMBLY_ACC=CAM_ASM_000872 /TAXON_ID= /ORGANISM="Pseudokeronopsis sp., Strain Brazil" /LENGTH=92 /DNA_ID=CAMNT_0049701403 /DNA_START=191 /DNA_END=465 /DNA_ORIENTATION=+